MCLFCDSKVSGACGIAYNSEGKKPPCAKEVYTPVKLQNIDNSKKSKLNIYTITNTKELHLGSLACIRSAVVIAESEEAARAIYPQRPITGEGLGKEDWDGKAVTARWCAKEQVRVQCIGVAHEGAIVSVVCARRGDSL
jgi:hypothetical protein